jgi:hypothetical protein
MKHARDEDMLTNDEMQLVIEFQEQYRSAEQHKKRAVADGRRGPGSLESVRGGEDGGGGNRESESEEERGEEEGGRTGSSATEESNEEEKRQPRQKRKERMKKRGSMKVPSFDPIPNPFGFMPELPPAPTPENEEKVLSCKIAVQSWQYVASLMASLLLLHGYAR